MKSRYLLLQVVVVLTALTACRARSEIQQSSQPAESDSIKRPHILIVVVDTLRADRLGCYGNPNSLTPTMDQWAAEGVVFEQAIAPAPWTLPSIASLFTATYPPVHRANSSRYDAEGRKGGKAVVRGIPENLPTLFTNLKDVGYVALGLTANHFLKGRRGFNRDFEKWQFTDFVQTRRGEHLNQVAFDWFDNANFDQPHIIYLHYMDPHEPYWAEDKLVQSQVDRLPEKEHLRRVANPNRSLFRRSMGALAKDARHQQLARYVEYWAARYDAGVAQVDTYLAELQKDLAERGLWDDLFVILTADHGEALGEHGRWSHGDTTLQVELQIPLVMRWPSQLPAGKRISPPVSLVDVMPTICEAVQAPISHRIQGRGLMGMINADDPSRTELAFVPVFAAGVQRRPNEFAVIQRHWKLRSDPTHDLLSFYDLSEDPYEEEPLPFDFTSEISTLQDLLEKHKAESVALAEGLSGKTETLSPEELKALRTLGYLGGGDE